MSDDEVKKSAHAQLLVLWGEDARPPKSRSLPLIFIRPEAAGLLSFTA
jgi:hypothetical protein